jgi:hypothetical protein
MRFVTLWALTLLAADAPDPREPLRPLADLIGSWKGLGTPEGNREEKQRGHWQEGHAWQWQFKDGKAWFRIDFKDGKHFTHGDLHATAGGQYRFTVQTVGKQSLEFTGKLTGRQLILERTDPQSKETQRLVWNLLHANRLVYRYEAKPEGRVLFNRVYQVGATKEGSAFVNVPTGPECIVSGGAGTSTVTYKGKTYYVCCSGCRDAFLDDPETYIKEYEAKLKKK